jgi:hypothetical protein
MYNCNCLTIPFGQMRYQTLGDFWTDGGCIQFRVASMGNADFEFLVFLHEIVEKQLARKMGVTEQMIDAWDLAHEDEEEPGAMEGCPYREAHLIAEGIERAVAVKLGVDWAHYEKTCQAVMSVNLPPADPTVRDDPDTNYRHGAKANGGRRSILTAKAKARSVLREK